MAGLEAWFEANKSGPTITSIKALDFRDSPYFSSIPPQIQYFTGLIDLSITLSRIRILTDTQIAILPASVRKLNIKANPIVVVSENFEKLLAERDIAFK